MIDTSHNSCKSYHVSTPLSLHVPATSSQQAASGLSRASVVTGWQWAFHTRCADWHKSQGWHKGRPFYVIIFCDR